MRTLRVHLLGKPSLIGPNDTEIQIKSQKIRALLYYLLLFRDKSHHREKLASLFWGDQPAKLAKKSFRQTLWKLQTSLEKNHINPPLLDVRAEWVSVNPKNDFWLDIAVLEEAYALVRGVRGRDLEEAQSHTLWKVAHLYRGDLMEGWYPDWCLIERERFQYLYIMMLEKLMSDCEVKHLYEDGLEIGNRILRIERASERTHRRMMRLYYFIGDRTAALRQFERCAETLQAELGVNVAQRTADLHQLICQDQLISDIRPELHASDPHWAAILNAMFDRLNRVSGILEKVQVEVQEDIRIVESYQKK